MYTFEKIEIMGTVGKIGETRKTKSGSSVVNVSVAVSVGEKQADGTWLNTTNWYDAVFFGALCDRALVQLNVGDKIVVDGTPRVDSYVNRDGEHIAKIVITANRFFIAQSKADRAKSSAVTAQQAQVQLSTSLDDDIPF